MGDNWFDRNFNKLMTLFFALVVLIAGAALLFGETATERRMREFEICVDSGTVTRNECLILVGSMEKVGQVTVPIIMPTMAWPGE